MNLQEIRKECEKRPFEPFEIVLVDGRVFPVRHIEFIWVPPGRTTWVYVANAEGLQEIINTAVISSIRPHKNGKRRKAG